MKNFIRVQAQEDFIQPTPHLRLTYCLTVSHIFQAIMQQRNYTNQIPRIRRPSPFQHLGNNLNQHPAALWHQPVPRVVQPTLRLGRMLGTRSITPVLGPPAIQHVHPAAFNGPPR